MGRGTIVLEVFGWLQVGLLAGVLVGCATLEARDLIRQGNTAYETGRFEEAISFYTRSLELEPDGVTVLWNRACAAEAAVLQAKDAGQPEARKRYTDMALEDFHRWYERLLERTDEDAKQVADHRLVLLEADERCDDLLQHWLDQHQLEPKSERWYGYIARQYAECGQPAKTREWFIKRTQDFPTSVAAWHQLATLEFEPLWPELESGLPYNDAISPADRIQVANRVIELLDRASAIDPKFRDAYAWRAIAYTQRQHARIVVTEPTLPEEMLEAIRAREDAMLSWKQQKAICDLDQLPECPSANDPPLAPGQSCCVPPPMTPEEQAQEAVRKTELLALVQAADVAALEEPATKPKRSGR